MIDVDAEFRHPNIVSESPSGQPELEHHIEFPGESQATPFTGQRGRFAENCRNLGNKLDSEASIPVPRTTPEPFHP
jgi:hypothetical protein